MALALVLARLRLPGRPHTVCLLRAVTGVPCPFCGGTTAAVDAGSGDLRAALAASPLAVLAAPVGVALPLLRKRLAAVPQRALLTVLIGALVVSEVWQLHRFGWL